MEILENAGADSTEATSPGPLDGPLYVLSAQDVIGPEELAELIPIPIADTEDAAFHTAFVWMEALAEDSFDGARVDDGTVVVNIPVEEEVMMAWDAAGVLTQSTDGDAEVLNLQLAWRDDHWEVIGVSTE